MKHFITFILSFFICTSLFAQWESIGSGVDASPREYFCISAVDENTVWAVTTNPNFVANFEYAKTIDGGLTWNADTLPNVGNYYPANIFALDDSKAWAVMVNIPQQHQSKILHTNNGGLTWAEQWGEFNEVGHAFAALHFFNELEGLAFGSPGTGNTSVDSLQIFRTEDGGATWNRIPPAWLPDPLPGEGVWVYSGNNSYDAKGDTLWFVTRAGRVFRTTDKGVSWFAYDAGLSGAELSSIAFQNVSTGIVAAYNPARAAKTVDGGATWEEITVNVPDMPSFGEVEYVPGTSETYILSDGFVGFNDAALLTRDGGVAWEILDLPPTFNCMQFISPSVGFGGGAISVADNMGLYKWTGDLSDPTHIEAVDVLDNGIGVYPNPATEALYLKLPEVFATETYKLEVYAINGKMVFAKNNLTNSQNRVNVKHLADGKYIVKVIGSDGIHTNMFIKE